MRRRIKDEDGNYIWFDNEQEYQAYLQDIRNSWPNKIKRFFHKVVAIFVGILVLLFVVGTCNNQNKTKASTEKTSTEVSKKKSTRKTSTKKKSFVESKKATIKPEKEEISEVQSSVADKDATPEIQNEQPKEIVEQSTQAKESSQENPSIEE